ncbi:uncharacterized protein LOC106472432 [Limulus polyphemus]|uniref:Uncharacterized protein LOC106472432 n=1 Tax=Limulus polyphemus TaxID=6850 RepID=A0ABM1TLF8_LIMPO|nr:uncharacterized protein LOC106472432 [Limulus polyphemus]XP_022256714.1 uncharacterized protein LOC106472432 [Limulus polyphemus]
MPATLVGLSPSIRRTESTRSDHSDVSSDSRASGNKKVSFNKAVRIKKYPRRPNEYVNGSDVDNDSFPSMSPEKKFWFKIYKNRRHGDSKLELRKEYDYYSENRNIQRQETGKNKLPPIVEMTNTSNHQRRFPVRTTSSYEVETNENEKRAEDTQIKQNHVKSIVNIFNKEATVQRGKKGDPATELRCNTMYKIQPSDPPIDYSGAIAKENRVKSPTKNRIEKGVKVMFSKSPQEKEKGQMYTKNLGSGDVTNRKEHSENRNSKLDYGRRRSSPRANRSTEELGSYQRIQSVDDDIGNEDYELVVKRSEQNKEAWDGGDRLISDVSECITSNTQYPDSQHFEKTLERRQQTWHNDKATRVYEDTSPKPGRRRVKSYDDLLKNDNREWRTFYKEGLLRNSPERIIPENRAETFTKEIGIQCNTESLRKSFSHRAGKNSRIIRPSGGYVFAFSNVPIVEEKQRVSCENQLSNNAIYSQVDKTKKSKHKTRTDVPTGNEVLSQKGSLRQVKSKNRSFGFKLNTGFHVEEDEKKTGNDETGSNGKEWYDENADIHLKNQWIHQDASSEMNSFSRKNGIMPSSLIREVDSKNREINYENVPHGEKNWLREGAGVSDLWFQEASEDYRQEMFSLPSSLRDKETSNVRQYSGDQKYQTDTHRQNDCVWMKVRGMSDGDNNTMRREKSNSMSLLGLSENNKPSSVQSEPSYVRGGLAAAYNARQRAALGKRTSPVNRHHGILTSSSAASVISSSDSDSARYHAYSSVTDQIDNEVPGSRTHVKNESNSPNDKHSTKIYHEDSPRHQHRKNRLENSQQQNRNENTSHHKTIYYENSPHYPYRTSRNEGSPRAQRNSAHHEENRPVHRNMRVIANDESGAEEAEDILSPLKPARKQNEPISDDEWNHNDLQRRHSMPKNAKLKWFKWKVKGKPTREQ